MALNSNLYKTGRLINLDNFIIRVEAAMLKYAQTVPIGPNVTSTEKNFAIWVLKNPMQMEMSMISLVASDPNVLSSVIMASEDLADVSNLPDSAIENAVAAKWSLVSSKFPTAT
jgi:hypothetical protein